jgi:uncharacterized protein (DUF885 family)
MKRRSFIAGMGAAGATALLPAAVAAAAAEQAGTTADAALRTLLDAIFYERIGDSPEAATRLGLDKGVRAALKSKLDDESATAVTQDIARNKSALARLRKIDRAGLSPEGLLDYDVVEYQLATSISGSERFTYGNSGGRFAPYILSQLSGPYRDVPDFLDSQHRIADAADADAYMARLAAFPTAIDDSSNRQRSDAARGVFAPDFILDTTLKQLAKLRDQAPESSVPVTALAAKLKAAGLHDDRVAAATAIMRDKVFPALDRQRALVTELRAKASHDAGVWRLPNGEA